MVTADAILSNIDDLSFCCSCLKDVDPATEPHSTCVRCDGVLCKRCDRCICDRLEE